MSIGLYMTDLIQPKRKPIFDTFLDHNEPYLPPTTLFNRGKMCYSNVVKTMNQTDQQFRDFLYRSLIRHLTGDWGDICPVDTERNNTIISECGGILKYTDGDIVSYFNYPPDEGMSLYVTTGMPKAHRNSVKTKISIVKEY